MAQPRPNVTAPTGIKTSVLLSEKKVPWKESKHGGSLRRTDTCESMAYVMVTSQSLKLALSFHGSQVMGQEEFSPTCSLQDVSHVWSVSHADPETWLDGGLAIISMADCRPASRKLLESWWCQSICTADHDISLFQWQIKVSQWTSGRINPWIHVVLHYFKYDYTQLPMLIASVLTENICRWLPPNCCGLTDVRSSVSSWTTLDEHERAVHLLQLISLVVHCSSSGFLPMALQEGKEPKITTSATTGFSYLPFFLWRKEMYFTFWWDTREKMHVQEWVGHGHLESWTKWTMKG